MILDTKLLIRYLNFNEHRPQLIEMLPENDLS